MSGGFSAAWLTLRERADARARAAVLTRRLRAWARQQRRRPLAVVDLGAGSGSNLRYLAPRLPRPQRWRLVDHDAALLAEAERALAGTKSSPTVDTVVADLANADLKALVGGAQVITASALFDLVSAEWCERLLAAIAAPGRCLLAVLTYDGRSRWQSSLADDDLVVDLVNRHQRRDKGFGPALGPAAAAALPKLARQAGARVFLARSDWQLGEGDATLHGALVTMLARAACEQAPEAAHRIAAWRDLRMAAVSSSRLIVGHVDMLAIW